MTIKTISRVSIWLILILAVHHPATAYGPELLSEKDMKGTLKLSEKSLELLGVGDNVVIGIDSSIVIVGDRMKIYEVIKSQKQNEKGERLVTPIGRLVITDIRNGMVVGKMEFAKREIFLGSYIDFTLPKRIQESRYQDFIRMIVDARLKDPFSIKGRIKMAIVDVTDEWGNINRLGETIYGELSEAVCARPQFTCQDRGELISFLAKQGVTTSRAIGRYIRKKLFKEFGLQQLITATAVMDGEQVKIIVSAYDLEKEFKTPEMEITALRNEFFVVGGPPEEVLVRLAKTGHGFLKVSFTSSGFRDGRQADYLFTENLQNYIFEKHLKSLSENLSEDVSLGNLKIQIGRKTYKHGLDRTLYNDIIESKVHTLKIFVTPVLKGEENLAIGKPIEKTVRINVPFDSPVHTEIILKTWGGQAFILVDTNPLAQKTNLVTGQLQNYGN